MRVLLACSLGGSGHLRPVLSAARAVRRLGHQTVVLVPPSLVAEIEREDLPYAVGEEPPRAVIDETWDRVRTGPPEAVAGVIDRDLFANQCTQAMLAGARLFRDQWRQRSWPRPSRRCRAAARRRRWRLRSTTPATANAASTASRPSSCSPRRAPGSRHPSTGLAVGPLLHPRRSRRSRLASPPSSRSAGHAAALRARGSGELDRVPPTARQRRAHRVNTRAGWDLPWAYHGHTRLCGPFHPHP